jgi:hypothetical protein
MIRARESPVVTAKLRKELDFDPIAEVSWDAVAKSHHQIFRTKVGAELPAHQAIDSIGTDQPSHMVVGLVRFDFPTCLPPTKIQHTLLTETSSTVCRSNQ